MHLSLMAVLHKVRIQPFHHVSHTSTIVFRHLNIFFGKQILCSNLKMVDKFLPTFQPDALVILRAVYSETIMHEDGNTRPLDWPQKFD